MQILLISDSGGSLELESAFVESAFSVRVFRLIGTVRPGLPYHGGGR